MKPFEPVPALSPVSTIKEFCEYLKINRTCLIDNFLFRKDFPAYKIGRHWRIKSNEALAYIEQRGSRR